MKILIICSVSIAALCYIANTYHLPPPQTKAVVAIAAPPERDTLLVKLSRAVAQIESRGNHKARRFEPHVFTRFTGQVASTFNEAKAINWRAAMMSTSCGKYQILGCNYRKAGFTKVEQMFRADSQTQDSAFVRFIKGQNIYHLIKSGKYSAFARCYNGAGYKKNRYDSKLIAEMR
jgi:muramidase (phage lysozyme)